MRKSQKNNSKLSRFVYYKNSGLIVFVPLTVLGIIGYIYMESEKDFYDTWSCDTVSDYLMDINVPKEFPNAHTLPEEQHLELHRIQDECVKSERFAEPPKH